MPKSTPVAPEAPPGAGLHRGQHAGSLNPETRVVFILSWVFAGLGVVLRVQRLLLGRSFRGDEAAMALGIHSHSFLQLITQPMGASLTAPVSFLALEKLIELVFGTQDFIYRLLPLLAGVLSVGLMAVLAKRVVGGPAALFCIGALAVNWVASFYSSDVKQYSSDILVALVIYLTASRYFESGTSRDALILAVSGVLAISYSHPAIFVLACVPPVLLIKYYRRRPALLQILVMSLLWVVVFGTLYLMFYRVVGQTNYIVEYWDDLNGLMPMPPWKDPSWFVIRTESFITTVLTLTPLVPVVLALYAAGLVSFVQRGQWHWSVWLFGTVVMTLVASAIANYPFKGRLLLFLIPAALLTIGEGVRGLASLLGARPVLHRIALWAAVAFLLWTPASSAYAWLQQPRSAPYPEDIKPALSFMQANKEPGDLILVYDQAVPTYTYYAPFFGLTNNTTVKMPDYRQQPNKYKGMIDAVPRGQRTWIVFSAVVGTKGDISERDFILDYVHRSGGQVLLEQSVSGGISSTDLFVMK